jgi:hypothetical protein
VPKYGRWSGRWPKGIGVHECQNGYWYQLADGDAVQRIQISHNREETAFIDQRK